jgi:outer membrane protein TolC
VVSTSRATSFTSTSRATTIGRSSGVSLSMLLYDFGQREMKLEAAEQALKAAGHSYNSGLQGAIALAMQGYYNLLNAQNALTVAIETQRYAKESFEAAQLRHKIGQVPLADVLQARGVLSSQLLGTMQAKNQLALAQAALAQLMGQPADKAVSVKEVDNKTLNREPFGDEVKDLMEKAKQQRQDLLASREQLKQSQTSLRALKRSNIATVSATTDLGVANSERTTLTGPGATRSQSVGISVSIPIFTGFSNTYNIRSAEKSLEAQTESLKGTELKVEQDVWNAWHNYQTAKQSWETSQDQLLSATQLRDVALGRYKEGLGTILDVLNAQSQYNSALQSNLQSRYNILTSRVDLVRAVGSLNMDNAYPQPDDSDAIVNEPEKEGSREKN